MMIRLLCILIVAVVAMASAVSANAQTQAAAPAAPREEAPEPKVERIVVQDDAMRIDELRVRGVTQSVSVSPKNAPQYNVAPTTPAKPPEDKSQGRRTWRLFWF
jgi:hypothetical protein